MTAPRRTRGLVPGKRAAGKLQITSTVAHIRCEGIGRAVHAIVFVRGREVSDPSPWPDGVDPADATRRRTPG
jgi:hypothetical protein